MDSGHGQAQALMAFTDADQAVRRIEEIYAQGAGAILGAFGALARPEGPGSRLPVPTIPMSASPSGSTTSASTRG